MKLNEINFSFGGLHCLRDFGAIYAEKSGHIISPAISRNEYEIAGTPGSILMPGDLPETLPFSGTLYFLDDPPTQAAAQERRDPGMGMDHVRPLPANDVTENGPGTAHLPKAPAVHGRLVVADAGRLDLRHIDTSIGYDDNIVPLVLQLLGQLQDMCLRPTYVHAHGGHEDLHWVPPLQVIFNRWLPLFR